jgi:hypothetical protein
MKIWAQIIAPLRGLIRFVDFSCKYDYDHTMSYSKVTITVDQKKLIEADKLVAENKYHSRSHFFQVSAEKELVSQKHNTLIEACNCLDIIDEQLLAEEGFLTDAEAWESF